MDLSGGKERLILILMNISKSDGFLESGGELGEWALWSEDLEVDAVWEEFSLLLEDLMIFLGQLGESVFL